MRVLRCQKIIVFISLLIFSISLHTNSFCQETQEVVDALIKAPFESVKEKINLKKKFRSLMDWLDKPIYKPHFDRKLSKDELRGRWHNFVGWDLFLPYFKAEHVEEWVAEKTAVEIFKMKGRAEFKKDAIGYILKRTF